MVYPPFSGKVTNEEQTVIIQSAIARARRRARTIMEEHARKRLDEDLIELMLMQAYLAGEMHAATPEKYRAS